MKIIAVASHGGHWIQLMRLRSLFDSYDTFYVSTERGLGGGFPVGRYFKVIDAAKEKKINIAICMLQAAFFIIKVRPDFVVTTGAAPGLSFVVMAKIFRVKSIWIDSIANGSELSLSGRIAMRFSDLCLSQWEDVARQSGAKYLGRVI